MSEAPRRGPGRPPGTSVPLCEHPDRHGVGYVAAEEWLQKQRGERFSMRAACFRATIILGENYDVDDPRFPNLPAPVDLADPAARRNSQRVPHKNARGRIELTLRNRTGGRGKDWSADAENLRSVYKRVPSPADLRWREHAQTAWILYLDPRGTAQWFGPDIDALRRRCERETHAQEFWARMWRIRPLLVETGLLPPT